MKKYGRIIVIVIGILVVIALLILIYFKTSFISRSEVKDIVANNMNVSSNDLYFESIDFEMDNSVYEVEVYYQNRDYEYKIDAKEGKVIYTDFRSVNTNNNQNNSDNSNNGNTNNQNSLNGVTASITLDEAKNIALTNANLVEDDVSFLRTEQEYDDGILVYEIDFTYDTYEYDYKINANTGEIVSYDRDSIYD